MATGKKGAKLLSTWANKNLRRKAVSFLPRKQLNYGVGVDDDAQQAIFTDWWFDKQYKLVASHHQKILALQL